MTASRPFNTRQTSLVRFASLLLWAMAPLAHAQAIGQGLISYASGLILFLGVAAIVTALVGAIFKPEVVRTAAFAAFILVIIFFILRNTASLQAAVSGG
jgi:hypothetical protein